jgi:hypothetical protein
MIHILKVPASSPGAGYMNKDITYVDFLNSIWVKNVQRYHGLLTRDRIRL